MQIAGHSFAARAGISGVLAAGDCDWSGGDFAHQRRVADGGVDGGARRDGRGMHRECEAMRASALLRDGSVLPVDGGGHAVLWMGDFAVGPTRMELDRVGCGCGRASVVLFAGDGLGAIPELEEGSGVIGVKLRRKSRLGQRPARGREASRVHGSCE